jgi:hypothetical protein
MLTEKQQRALDALLAEPSRVKAAAAAGISTRQLRRYIANPEFQQEYRQAMQERLKACMNGLQGAAHAAAITLAQIAANKEISPQVRINAAEAILRQCLRYTETCDILERLAAVEEKLNNHETDK